MKRLAKGYSVLVQWDSSYQAHTARCVELPCCLGYDKDPNCALSHALEALEDHLKYREELCINP